MKSEWVTYFKNTNRSIFSQCISCRQLYGLIIDHTPKGGRILEIGCGTAVMSLILADYGFDVTASDISVEVLKHAKEKVNLKKMRLKFVEGDILKLSDVFKNQHFDTICHKGVMEHFSDEDIVKGFVEQGKIAKRIIFHVPNNRLKCSGKFFGDERFLTNKKWVKLIKKAGFRNVKVIGNYDVPRYTYFLLPGVFFNLRLSFWWKWFSRHSIFICEK